MRRWGLVSSSSLQWKFEIPIYLEGKSSHKHTKPSLGLAISDMEISQTHIGATLKENLYFDFGASPI